MVSPLPPSAAALRQSATRLGAQLAERMTPRQRQFALLGAIVAAGVGLLWLIFASTDTGSSSGSRKPAAGAPGPVTNIGVMPPGQQVNPVDQWVGTAGSKLAQYESEREEQTRLNRDRQAFEARTMQRFADLEQRLTSATQAAQGAAAPAPAAAPVPPVPAPLPPALPSISAGTTPTGLPPAASLPLPSTYGPGTAGRQLPAGMPGLPTPDPAPATPAISRVTLVDRSMQSVPGTSGSASERAGSPAAEPRAVSTWLPVSFTRGTLLGGLSVLTSPFLIALLWALPAIGLMLHVLRSLATRAAHSAAGASVRQLQRRMRDWTGQSQRDLQLFSRVETAFLHRLHQASGPEASLAAAAAEAGYADQSHMGREIRRVTGLSPARFEERMATDEAFWYYRLIASALRPQADPPRKLAKG